MFVYREKRTKLSVCFALFHSQSDEESYSETKIRLEDDEGYADDGQGKQNLLMHMFNACVECVLFPNAS